LPAIASTVLAKYPLAEFPDENAHNACGVLRAKGCCACAKQNPCRSRRSRGSVEVAAVESEWSGVLRTVRAGMLAVPSRIAARLPQLSRADVAEIDAEIRAVLIQIGEGA